VSDFSLVLSANIKRSVQARIGEVSHYQKPVFRIVPLVFGDGCNNE
jgi:hypothetical protein